MFWIDNRRVNGVSACGDGSWLWLFVERFAATLSLLVEMAFGGGNGRLQVAANDWGVRLGQAAKKLRSVASRKVLILGLKAAAWSHWTRSRCVCSGNRAFACGWWEERGRLQRPFGRRWPWRIGVLCRWICTDSLSNVAMQSWLQRTPMEMRECGSSWGRTWAVRAPGGRSGQSMEVVPVELIWCPSCSLTVSGDAGWRGRRFGNSRRKCPVVPVSAMAVVEVGMRVLVKRRLSLSLDARTLLPACHRWSGLLARLPPMVLSRVARSWWPGALFWHVSLVGLFPTRYPCVQQ